MMAGAFHLRFRDYMLGSLLGILPGLAAVTLLGSQLGELISAENHEELLWSLGGLALGIGLLIGFRYTSRRRASRQRTRSGHSSQSTHTAPATPNDQASSDSPSMSQSQSSDDSARD
jgi:hypothetical protein